MRQGQKARLTLSMQPRCPEVAKTWDSVQSGVDEATRALLEALQAEEEQMAQQLETQVLL